MAFDPTKHFSNYGQNTSTNTHRATRNDTARGMENDFSPTASDTNSLLQTSTNIFVYSNGAIVGMIQSFSVSEQRTINKLQAIGWEGVVQAVPANTNGGQLQVSRIALYQSSIWNALGLTSQGKAYNPLGMKVHEANSPADATGWDAMTHYNETEGSNVSSRLIFKTLKDQRVPLEVKVQTKRKGSESDYYVETYIDCWLSSYSKSYTVQTITVAEQATVQYADVY
jgi:hypothetical protein